jgi:cytochrome b561
MATTGPVAATTGHPLLDRIAPVTHYGFYILALLMAATGLATAILGGLNRSIFQATDAPLPPSSEVHPSFVAPGNLALLLAGLIILHAVAALYHQCFLKDRLQRRMWFGRRASDPPATAN